MNNPFYDIVKADELTPNLAAALFIEEASPIWTDILYPTNHLVIGPRGAGKTIALRQLDHRSARSTSETPYIGIYIQISRISTIFQHLFDEHAPDFALQRVFSDYLWLEIIKELSHFVGSSSSQLDPSDPSVIARLTNGVIDAPTADALASRCSNIQTEIEEGTHQWSMTGQCDWTPKADLAASLRRTIASLRTLCPYLHQDKPSLYLLFDESSPIPVACQRVINGLLHRGRSYCVKLAVRPYEWSTLITEANRTIELNTDVRPLHMHYPNELESGYLDSMRAVANRALATRRNGSASLIDGWPSGTSIDIQRILSDDALRYSGFPAVCATSSGNPQNLLSICSCIFATAIQLLKDYPERNFSLARIPARVQHDAIVRWSKDYEEQNPYEESRAFCRSLLRRVRQQPEKARSIGFLYDHGQPDLFTEDYLPPDVGSLIAAAFSGGFLRITHTDRTSVMDVPAAFHLNRGLLPREGLPLNLPTVPAEAVDRTFVRQNARDRVHLPAKSPKVNPDRTISVFLSTSFARSMEQQRIDIKRVLFAEGLPCVDVEDVSGDQFLFTSVAKGIRSNDVTLFDATVLRPYTMLEIGMCAVVTPPRCVICIVNSHGKDRPLAQFPGYLKKLPILTFSFDQASLSRLAADVRNRSLELLGKRSEFQTVDLTDTPLRRKQRQRTVFLSLPDRPLRERAIAAVKASLKDLGWTVLVEDDMQTYGANELQVAIQCAYTSRVGIIDTTGETAPDLLQCYKLGLFAGRRKPWRVKHIEEEQYERLETFDSVPNLSPSSWNTIEDLVVQVEGVRARNRGIDEVRIGIAKCRSLLYPRSNG